MAAADDSGPYNGTEDRTAPVDGRLVEAAHRSSPEQADLAETVAIGVAPEGATIALFKPSRDAGPPVVEAETMAAAPAAQPLQLDTSTWPSEVRDLLDNVTIERPSGERAPSLLSGAARSLGPYILFGPLGGSPGEKEHALEIRKVAAPRRCVVRRAAGGTALQRAIFAAEARAGRALEHPAIVRVHDAGEDQGRPYLVREYVDGASLEELLAKSGGAGLPLAPVLAAGAQIAAALGYAHDLRDESGEPLCLVHGEIDPAAILIAKTGQPKLTELGLAAFEGRPLVPGAEARGGKPGCAAPEQLGGAKIDGRTDLFSLGVTLARALGAQSLELAALASHLGARGGASASVAGELSHLLAHSMAAAPDDRPETAGQVAAVLYDLLDRVAPNEEPQALLAALVAGHRVAAAWPPPREEPPRAASDTAPDPTVPVRGPVPRPPRSAAPGARPVERTSRTVKRPPQGGLQIRWWVLAGLFVLGLLIGAASWLLL